MDLRSIAARAEPILAMADIPEVTAALRELGPVFILPEIDDWSRFAAHEGKSVRVLVQLGRTIADDRIFDALPSLELVAVVGAGYEGLDVAALAARGVAVTNGRGANADDVADLAVAMALALARRVIPGDRLVRNGEWKALPAFAAPARSLSDTNFGIVGLGTIGLAIARRLAPFEGGLAWWGPNAKPEVSLPRAASLANLAKESDILLVAAPMTSDSFRLIDRTIIDALGPEGHLVNVSRGPVVDQAALLFALQSGRLAGAGLDVFETEPFFDPAWNALDNVILTPHMAGWATAAARRMRDMLIENIASFREGRPLLSPVR